MKNINEIKGFVPVSCGMALTSFYTRHFQGFCGGCKEMDFLTYDPTDRVSWFVEVKDYRVDQRNKQGDLADEIAQKTRDVLAMLPVAGVRDNGISQKGCLQVRDFWNQARGAIKMRIVLHCELPVVSSKLFPGVKDAANLQTKLSQKLRCVDPNVLFTNRTMVHIPLERDLIATNFCSRRVSAALHHSLGLAPPPISAPARPPR